MTRHIIWKEAREQGAVLLALVGMGAGLLAATAIVGGATGAAEGLSLRTFNLTYIGRILLVMLVMTAGLVSGGSLFAGEREQGTFAYLDHLPASRWRVWWRKVLAGGLLTLLAAGLLLVAAGLAGQLGGSSPPVLIGWAMAVLVLAAVGFGWGAFGSARAESSLGACGLGLAGAWGTVGVSLVVAVVLVNLVGGLAAPYLGYARQDEGGLVGLLVAWAILCVPLPLAALVYTAPDRNRRLAEQDIRPELVGFSPRLFVPRLPRLGGFGRSRRMNWLLWRQLRVTLAVTSGIALVLGLFVVPWNPDWPSSLIWPGVGLVLGVLTGVASLGDEQRTGAARFWAERRLPIGRLWRDKVVNGGLILLTACVVALLPSFIAAVAHGNNQRFSTLLGVMFRSGLFDRGFPQLTYLFLGPVYGFAFGHLAGMLFQKGIVAGAVGLMLGGTFGAAWGPSLLAGGVHGWMVYVPPTVALLTARWLSWAWATDRLGRRGPLLRLAGGTFAALLCVAAAMAYRAVGEVEAAANADEHLKFRADLPTFDDLQPGRDIRRALGKWQELPERLRTELNGLPWPGRRPVEEGFVDSSSRRYTREMVEVLRDGWSADRGDFDRWLDEVFATDWDEPLYLAASEPPGVLEDPNEMQGLLNQPLRYIPVFQELTPVFLARGLQQQARGDPADFVIRLDAWLAAVRTAKRHTLPVVVMTAESCERQVFQALDRWLERLDGRPDLVRLALAVVRRHDELDRPQAADVRLSEQVLFQNAVDAPGLWLPRWLDREDGSTGSRAGYRADAEANLTAFAWAVPWEKERLRRTVALGNDPARRAERAELLRGAPGLDFFDVFQTRFGQQTPYSPKPVAARRAAIVSLALRLHRLDTGGYPAALDELVPARLPAVPLDPYDPGRPLRYRRLAKAEAVVLPTHLVARARPALPPGTTLLYREYLLVAGMAGGLTGWPFQPGWYVPEAEEADGAVPWRARAFMGNGMPGGPGGAELPLAAEWLELMTAEDRVTEVRLAAGRAVVWSVGEDRQDDGGRFMDDRPTRHTGGGDLVYVVPDPPAASPAKPAPAR